MNVYKSIKLLCMFSLATILFIKMGTSVELAVYGLFYFIGLFIIPLWMEDNKIVPLIKLILVTGTGIIGIFSIIHFNGVEKELYSYIVVYFIAILYSLIKNYKFKIKK